ncbi:MAG: bifunctional diaminohydroxyphosphoribosylaminopyrimidine deaminase/5-amino-6-(5-phosphoribosylamino)uracil reductase RibD [Pseudomonadota bacterium]
MAAASRLAARARPLSHPNPGVAAILVREGRVLARGWTQAGGRPHAEAHALSNIAPEAAQEATLYVTLEPCAHTSERGPACSELLTKIRPSRVVIGQIDPDPRTAGKGIALLEQASIPTTLLNDQASKQSLQGYLSQRQAGRPYVTLKLAVSLDGCIALADGTSQWITGEAARTHVHAQRARNDAILVGGGTWRSDRPRLDVRLPGLENRSPKRILLSRGVKPDDIAIINRPEQIGELEDVQYLYVEGGGETAASFLRDDLVDELHIYTAPILIGDGLHSLASLGLASLTESHGRWHRYETRQLGSDLFAAYLRTR